MAHQLVYSTAPTRTNPVALNSATVSGDIYPFVIPDGAVSQVRFYLDGVLRQVENTGPYDFAGSDPQVPANAAPFDTTTVSDGIHEIRAEVDSAGTQVLTASFLVSNGAPPPPPTPETGGNTSMRSAVQGSGTVNIRSEHPGPTRLVFSTPQSFKPGDYVAVTVPGYPSRFRFTIDFGSGTEWQAKEPTTLDQSGLTSWFRSNPQPGRGRGGSRFVASAKHYLYVSPLDQNGTPDWYTYVDTTIPEKGYHPYTRDRWTGQMWLGKDGTRYDTVKLIEDVRTRVDNLDGLVA